MKKLRSNIYQILEVSEKKEGVSWYFDVLLTILIACNAIVIVLESVQSINKEYNILFKRFEIISIIIFTMEYVLRIWVSVENKKYKHYFFGRVKYLFSLMGIIDLLAILPFYLIAMNVDFRYLRVLRLFRLFTLLKLAKYISAINVIHKVLDQKKEQLLTSIIFIFFMLLIVSGIMFYVENEVQPDMFSSIPETMWWGVATLTTVGYGDMYPITGLGQFLGGLIAVLGVGLFALPAGIIASGFSNALENDTDQEVSNFCTNCGKKITGIY